ncbi:Acetyltransferase (GNAT) family protein [Chitinophaga sp. CF118]|uniref:GNAT family N-acetyltransferase n=1 Tax=Chitinophaga sp. CF118 TaxID=1884367 RepID=UPI0008E501A9|nr:GNAT family N-acetyltransferase [Chitinophaga sp. CF118]SFD14564.1 Acetyltransferase (GNAT) family protein [Chitinophaga sp. CF118]
MITLNLLQAIPAEVEQLYELSFPVKERRNLSAQQELLKEGVLQLQIVQYNGEFAGFVFCWLLTGFIFIEHFAIVEGQRGGGIGSKVMSLLLAQYQQIVLEVEPPHSVDAERRIKFYEGLGFTAWPYSYRQPSYHAGGEPLVMWLMQKGMPQEEHAFSKITSEIYLTVYGI